MAISSQEFESLVAPHRRELHAYCYRMLGSPQDAEDALQETLLAAWKGFAGFEGRGALKSWLYRIATNACLRSIEQRPARILPSDRGPASETWIAGTEFEAAPWLEPYPVALDLGLELKESLELAFVAALQHLPAAHNRRNWLRWATPLANPTFVRRLPGSRFSTRGPERGAPAPRENRGIDGIFGPRRASPVFFARAMSFCDATALTRYEKDVPRQLSLWRRSLRGRARSQRGDDPL